MKKYKWRKGPPPSIGWWPASANDEPDAQAIRWWNGEYWSCQAYPMHSKEEAGDRARFPSINSIDRIQWTDRWWL